MPSKAKKRCNNKKAASADAATAAADPRPGERSVTFFWKSASPFSQWHESTYTLVINDVPYQYNCAEQGMMHGKALLFGDLEVAAQILAAVSPREMKALGRMVRGFDDLTWKQYRQEIVYRNSVAKFTQNRHLCEALLNTMDDYLVEASPFDKIWGIGVKEADARKMCHEKWPGLNLLGRILTRVRDEIQQGVHQTAFFGDSDKTSNGRRGVAHLAI